MFDHQVERLLAGPLGEFGVDRDVAAEQRLDARADVADDAARTHGQAAHHAEVTDDPVAGNVVGRCDDHETSLVQQVEIRYGRAKPGHSCSSQFVAATIYSM